MNPKVKWPTETRSLQEQAAFAAWTDQRNQEIQKARLEHSALRASAVLGQFYFSERALRAGVLKDPHQSLGVFFRGFPSKRS